MGLPFYTLTFSSLSEVEAFIHLHPDVLKAEVTVRAVHVRDIFSMLDVLSKKDGWVVENIDLIRDDARKFALYVEEYEFTVGEALKSIDDDGIITAELAEALRRDAVKFLNLVSGHASFDFFRGFAQYSVHVGDEAIEAAVTPDGEEGAGADGEGAGNEDAAADGDDAGAGGEEGGAADVEDADGDEAVVQAPSLVQLRGKLLHIKEALEGLPGLRLILKEPEEDPVTYADFADFADSFPLDPEQAPEE